MKANEILCKHKGYTINFDSGQIFMASRDRKHALPQYIGYISYFEYCKVLKKQIMIINVQKNTTQVYKEIPPTNTFNRNMRLWMHKT